MKHLKQYENENNQLKKYLICEASEGYLCIEIIDKGNEAGNGAKICTMSFDRNNGGINYIGKFFRSGSFEMLLDMAHFDGSYLYTRSEVYGGGYPGHYEIVKYKTTDLSIAARHPALNSSNSTMPVLTFVGDKAWAVIYSAGNYKYRELNKGDLTPTGDYYNNYILYSSYPFWVGNKPDGSIIWFYGVIKGDESNPGWKKWYSSSGTVSANITPEDETNWL